ncbi:MAG: MCE family protein [Candidatus Sericytochromatia bacterium]
MSKYKNELSLGIFTLVAAGILGYMTLSVGKFQFGPVTNIKVVFDSASGIVKDANVMVAGVEIGKVKKIHLEDNKAVMDVTLNENIKVSKNVKAVVRAKSLLGEKFVEFIPTKSEDYLKEGDVVKNTVTPVEIDQLITTLGPLMLKLGPVLEKVNPQDLTDMFKSFSAALKGKEQHIARIIENTDSLLTFFKKNQDKFSSIMTNVNSLSTDANSLINDNKGSINRIVTNTDKLMANFGGRADKLAKRIDIISSNLQDVTNDLQKKSPKIIDDVNSITGDLKVVSKDFSKNNPEFGKSIKSITNNIDKIVASINKEAPDLAKDLSKITKDLSQISAELSKKGPKMVDNTDLLLAKLVKTLNQVDPLMARLEKFDDKEIVKEIERVLRQVGIKIHLIN